IKQHKIIKISCVGQWEQLGLACNALLHNVTIHPWQLHLFATTGNLYDALPVYHPQEIVCYCMNLSYETLQHAIHNGMNDFELLTGQTGAGSVCGACIYKINGLLGNSALSLAYIDQIIPLCADIRA